MEEGETRCSALWRRRPSVPAGWSRRRYDARRHRLWATRPGTAILWRGDYQNARQLLQALGRRTDRRPSKTGASAAEGICIARPRRKKPAPWDCCSFPSTATIASPCAVARMWRRPAPRSSARGGQRHLAYGSSWVWWGRTSGAGKGFRSRPGERIHPWHGVFSPLRGYVDLVAEAPLPSTRLAFDIGTGTGILAALLVRRGVEKVVATDCGANARACARDNLQRLGVADRVEVVEANLFPAGAAHPGGL